MSRGSSSQMFQLKLDPLTGNSEWVVVGADDDGAGVEVELATTSYLDMLNDSCRNKAYREAIDKTVTRPCCVLDIGAGTGLLSMIAARAMPTDSDSHSKGCVIACESYLPMFKLMRKLVRCNSISMDKMIKIINKRSDELKIGLDIPTRADILVSEILDSELLGEGLIPTLQHAHDELLVQNPLTVPYRAIVYAQLLESSFLWKLHDLYNNDISASDAIRLLPPQFPSMLNVKPKQYPMHCDPLQHESKLLSEPFKIFEFDFSKRPDSHGEAHIFINSTAAGTVNAVISWWVLQLDQEGTIYYSTAPKWIKHLQPGSETWCDHWKQCVWFVPGKGLSVSRDEEIHLHAVHSDISISYSLRVASQRAKNDNSIRSDVFQLTLSPEKIATYSDDSWRHRVLLAVQNALCGKDYPLCFVADDSIFLATAIAHLCKTSRIMLLFPGLRERGFQYLQAIAETNQFSVNCMKLLDHRIDCTTMHDTDGKKVASNMITMPGCSMLSSALPEAEHLALQVLVESIDVLVGEPFYYGSENYLPWRNLRFWKERTRLERILSKDVHVIPSRGILRVSAMFLPDLWRSRCSLVNIEGFDHSGANTILGACGNLPSPQESPILPFFVWQSGETKELSERLTLMEFDFSKPMSSCTGKAKVDFTETGICHGFVLWIDWVLDEEDGIVVSTGPDHRHWKQGVKLLRTPVGVGSRDNKCSDEHHSVEMEASFDSTNGDLAIQYAFV